MNKNVRARFWLEAGLALLSGCLVLVTLLWPDWIEMLTGLEPDSRNGSLEAGITASFLSVSLLAALLSAREWRRAQFAMQ